MFVKKLNSFLIFMSDNKYRKCILGIMSYNNGDDLKSTINSMPKNFPIETIVHIDGSTDGSDKILNQYSFKVLKNNKNIGVGKSIKNTIFYSIQNNYEYLVVMPGNNKNQIEQTMRLFDPLVNSKAEYVQGSRYLKGSKRDNTPIFRLIMVKVHAFMFSILTGKKCTDALEGVRGYKLSLFKQNFLNIDQEWLDTYELETYIHYKFLTNNVKYTEVPISKLYPKNKISLFNLRGKKYSHIRPFIDWWKILRPIPLLIFKIKS